MKKLLFVHYHFLPVHNVGVKQVLGYCKYLPEFGWEPHVLTKPWGREIAPVDEGWGLSYSPELSANVAIERSDFSPVEGALLDLHRKLQGVPTAMPLRRLLSLFQPFFGEYPDRFVGWVSHAVRHGDAVVAREKIDAILSLCPPETNHLVASRLAARTGLPWVAGFGDLFGFFIGEGDWHRNARGRGVARWLRRRWLRRAASTFAVSPYMSDYLEREYGKKGQVVVVGFDEAEYPPAASPPRNRTMLVSYVGSIYPGDQKPELLFDALDRFLSRRPDAELVVRLVGTKQEDWLRATVGGRPCEKIVRIEKKIPADEASSLVRTSDVLLLLTTTALRDRHGTLSYPAKIFDYLGGQRPILSLPEDRDWIDSILTRTEAGVATSDPDRAADVLALWYDEWKRTGSIAWRGKREETLAFSHREQARKIAAALDEALG